jgi:hypothetical protein
MESDVFLHVYQNEFWPTTAEDPTEIITYYNHSLMNLKTMYGKVFPDVNPDNLNHQHEKGQRVYKIRYTVNTLP